MPTYATGQPIVAGDLVRRGNGKRLWRVFSAHDDYGLPGRTVVVLRPARDGYTTASAIGDAIDALVLLCDSCEHGTAGHHPACCVRSCTCTEAHRFAANTSTEGDPR